MGAIHGNYHLLAANIPAERKLIEAIELDHYVHDLKVAEALAENRPLSLIASDGRQFTYNS